VVGEVRHALRGVVVGTVALFKAQKGLSFLVEAARIATAVNPQLRFVHMGDGPLRDEVAHQIEAAGLGDRFQLLDRVPDPTRLLSGLDVFVLPSIWEGLPIALLEAMAAGLPAVGTAVSGIEDVIEHNRSGLLVPPADAGALADAILRVASDRALRCRLAEGAIARVARFSPDVVSSEYRQVTLQVLDSYRSARDHANRPAEHPQRP